MSYLHPDWFIPGGTSRAGRPYVVIRRRVADRAADDVRNLRRGRDLSSEFTGDRRMAMGA